MWNITFDQLYVRSSLLRKKYKLAETEKYANVYINPDEPIETRRAKAIFRRIGYQARQKDKMVMIRDDWIRIEDEVYRISDIDKIPEEYRQGLDTVPMSITSDVGERVNDSTTAQAGARPKTQKRVKIKLTKAGLTFSGPSAYLSHMYKASFVYNKTPYTSVEQGYHHIHATVEGETEIAATVMVTHEGYDLKDVAAKLPKSEKWANMAPGVVWKLNDAKYSQNPDLLKELIATAPARLIEASVDSTWGGACPFGSDIYDQGQVPGRNICGDQLTKYRDDIINERAASSMC